MLLFKCIQCGKEGHSLINNQWYCVDHWSAAFDATLTKEERAGSAEIDAAEAPYQKALLAGKFEDEYEEACIIYDRDNAIDDCVSGSANAQAWMRKLTKVVRESYDAKYGTAQGGAEDSQ